MTSINLLPWREEVKKYRNRQFYAMAILSALLGILIVAAINYYLNYRIEVEKANIEYLQKEEASIVGKVKEIAGLQEAKKALLNRMGVIQSLQVDRVVVAKIMDTLPRVIPDGVFLTQLARSSNEVRMEGNARSNTAISTLIKNMEDEKWDNLFVNPKLTEVVVAKEGNSLNFKMEFSIGKSIK